MTSGKQSMNQLSSQLMHITVITIIDRMKAFAEFFILSVNEMSKDKNIDAVIKLQFYHSIQLNGKFR